MKFRGKQLGAFICLSAFMFARPALAETPIYRLVLENHVFSPSKLRIPPNTKVKIIIENKDETAEEFDSFDLNRERVIFAQREASIFIGPLPIGRYEFFGEYHPNSARGYVIVEEESL